jgi:hypothetical protein
MAVTRERLTVIFAITYGAFVLIAVAPGYLFSFQVSQPLLYRIGVGAYTITLFPAALVGLLSKRVCGVWLMTVAILALVGLWQNEILRFRTADSLLILIGSLVWWAFVAAIPGVMGIILFKSKRAS